MQKIYPYKSPKAGIGDVVVVRCPYHSNDFVQATILYASKDEGRKNWFYKIVYAELSQRSRKETQHIYDYGIKENLSRLKLSKK